MGVHATGRRCTRCALPRHHVLSRRRAVIWPDVRPLERAAELRRANRVSARHAEHFPCGHLRHFVWRAHRCPVCGDACGANVGARALLDARTGMDACTTRAVVDELAATDDALVLCDRPAPCPIRNRSGAARFGGPCRVQRRSTPVARLLSPVAGPHGSARTLDRRERQR